MQKLIALVLALTLAASMAACGSGTPGGTGVQGTDTGPGDAPSVAELSLSGDIGGEITVSCYDTMKYRAFLEDAARRFEERYPGTKVHVEAFSAMPDVKTGGSGNQTMTAVQIQDDPQGRADYISKVNTSLMSGEGADILAMDVLPIQKYIESGQLENLIPYMDADPGFNRADYPGNILDAALYRGALWFVPMDYTFNYYAYDTTLLPDASGFGTGGAFTVEQLMDIAENSFDGSSKLFNTPDYAKGSGGMWGNLLRENYASFVDMENKKVNFKDGSFAALLESARQYSEQGYIPKGATGQADAGMMMQRSGDPPTDRFFFKPKNVFNLISYFTRSLGLRMNMMTAGGAMAIEEDDEIAGIAANAMGAVPFTCEQAYAINADSGNKRAAWAFLSFLLGEEMQGNTNLSPMALPLHNTAREEKMENTLTSMMKQQGEALNEDQLEAVKQFNEAVRQLSHSINTYVFEDSVVNDMISAEVQYFFEGARTAEEVANVLQSKVGLYLSE